MKVLQYSGGLDSLAALYVLRPEWDDITVVWCNTGSAYPDTVELMSKVRRIVPSFYEVESNVQAWRKLNGYAVDVVPERRTLIGSALISDPVKTLYTSFIRCCSANIWLPLEEASRKLGATVIYRGQKSSDKLKSPVKSGFEVEGVKYVFPIENWTRDEVLEYCLTNAPGLVPAYYLNDEESSHDCWNCMAYLAENVQRIKNLPALERAVILDRLSQYRDALQQETKPLEELL